MPLSSQIKDIIGPAISILAAALSGWFYFRNFRLARKLADRSIYVDGQKLIIEICKQMVADPSLWCLFDGHPMRTEKADELHKPVFQAKLQAFAHMHLNMFEIVLVEAPSPGERGQTNQSNVWIEYFDNTLDHSIFVRGILDEAESKKIWSPRLLAEYRRWKDVHIGS